jgi:hypothetical protein
MTFAFNRDMRSCRQPKVVPFEITSLEKMLSHQGCTGDSGVEFIFLWLSDVDKRPLQPSLRAACRKHSGLV